MTPAITAVKKAAIEFDVKEYEHDPNAAAYGIEAAQKLGVATNQVFKTLAVSLDGHPKDLAIALVPVCQQLNLKAVAKAFKVKSAIMADEGIVERTTGYVLGGVSPLGQKKKLPTVIDTSAFEHAQVYVSAGKRGVELVLSPNDLKQLAEATQAEIAEKSKSQIS